MSLSAGACQHALGYHAAAATDYQTCITADRGAANEEARGQQLAAFYQRELALYRHRRLDRPVADFCPDHDLHPIFKARSSSPCLHAMRQGRTRQSQYHAVRHVTCTLSSRHKIALPGFKGHVAPVKFLPHFSAQPTTCLIFMARLAVGSAVCAHLSPPGPGAV